MPRKPKIKIRHSAFTSKIATDNQGRVTWAGVIEVVPTVLFERTSSFRVYSINDGEEFMTPAESLHVDQKDAVAHLGQLVERHFSKPKMDDPMF